MRLNFLRQESAACSEEVIFPDFARRAQLPERELIAVEFTPDEEGEYEFHCGMGMLRGKPLVRWDVLVIGDRPCVRWSSTASRACTRSCAFEDVARRAARERTRGARVHLWVA